MPIQEPMLPTSTWQMIQKAADMINADEAKRIDVAHGIAVYSAGTIIRIDIKK